MKIIFLFIIIIIYPIISFATIDERKTDIYFANGIDTKEADTIDIVKKNMGQVTLTLNYDTLQ